MTKKILIISASPRRHGNSDILCDQFVAGVKEAGHDVEKVFLRDKNINIARAATPVKKQKGYVLTRMICPNCFKR